jgi:glycosyltransferase involved in cell wall biosynthesis
MRFSYTPEISVIMATFNRAGYLQRALQSVIAQSFTNWELIIVDDGSTDNTQATLNPFISEHPNIRYMKHRNRKAALARNAGIQAAFGRYITFLDSDDHYLDNHLKSRMEIITRHPEVDLLTGGYLCDETMMVKDCNNPLKLIHIRECTLGGTFFGKRELFCELEGFKDLDYAEDAELWKRASAGFSVMRIEDPKTYVYERASDSTTLNY